MSANVSEQHTISKLKNPENFRSVMLAGNSSMYSESIYQRWLVCACAKDCRTGIAIDNNNHCSRISQVFFLINNPFSLSLSWNVHEQNKQQQDVAVRTQEKKTQLRGDRSVCRCISSIYRACECSVIKLNPLEAPSNAPSRQNRHGPRSVGFESKEAETGQTKNSILDLSH